MLDAHRLRLLTEFAEHGSIAATAAALGYTPSAVSQQLAALEREAGAVLLDRTARSAELTDAGRRLADHGRRILAMIEAAEADLSARAGEPEGRVVVTAFPTAAAAFALALAHSLRVHPGLTLLLRQTQRGEGLRQLRSGGADVALVDDWSGGGAAAEPAGPVDLPPADPRSARAHRPPLAPGGQPAAGAVARPARGSMDGHP